MASALNIEVNELARVERGEIPIYAQLAEKFALLGVHPDSFQKKHGRYIHTVPLDVTTQQPLRKAKPLGANEVNLDLIRCHLFLTISTALGSTEDPAARLMVLHRVQQALREMPARFRLSLQPEVNVIELHNAAVALGKAAAIQCLLKDGMSSMMAEPGVARKSRRRKGGRAKMSNVGEAVHAELERDYREALARSGPKEKYNELAELAKGVLYQGVKRLVAHLEDRKRNLDPGATRALIFWQGVSKQLSTGKKPPEFVDAEWVARDLLLQTTLPEARSNQAR